MKLSIILLAATCVVGACKKDVNASLPGTTNTTSATLDGFDKSGVDLADSEMTAEVHNALLTSSTLGADATSIQVTTANGVITLRGRVTSEAKKALAESTAMSAAEGDQVDNQLEIVDASDEPDAGED